MSTSENEESLNPPLEPRPGPSPTDSGTKSGQQEANTAIEVIPRPQLSEVAECVTRETTGLVSIDPAYLQNLGAQRLLASYLNEQATNSAVLRTDMTDALERERESTKAAAELQAKLDVATATNKTEKKLRKPRTLFSMIGLSVAGFGVDQFGNGNQNLGVALICAGVVTVAATYFIAPADGGES